VRLGVQLPAPSSVPELARLSTLSRLSETVHELPSTPALDIVAKVSKAEAILETVKPSVPIEVPRLRELPVRVGVDATKHVAVAGEALRPALQISTSKTLPQPMRELEGVVERLSASPPAVSEVELPKLGESHVRAVETVALGSEGIPALASLPKLPQMGLPSTPALNIVRMERFFN